MIEVWPTIFYIRKASDEVTFQQTPESSKRVPQCEYLGTVFHAEELKGTKIQRKENEKQ